MLKKVLMIGGVIVALAIGGIVAHHQYVVSQQKQLQTQIESCQATYNHDNVQNVYNNVVDNGIELTSLTSLESKVNDLTTNSYLSSKEQTEISTLESKIMISEAKCYMGTSLINIGNEMDKVSLVSVTTAQADRINSMIKEAQDSTYMKQLKSLCGESQYNSLTDNGTLYSTYSNELSSFQGKLTVDNAPNYVANSVESFIVQEL